LQNLLTVSTHHGAWNCQFFGSCLPISRRNLLTLVIWAITLAYSVTSLVRGQEDNNRYNLLLKPSSREAMKSLSDSCRLWTQQPLRSALHDITRQYGVSIWLDRQIDPTQIVRLGQIEGEASLGEELARLAAETGNCGGLVENVYLIAPPDRFARIQRSAVVLHGQLASSHPDIGASQRPLQWPDISSSDEILDLIRQTWQAKIEYDLPHDLYYEGRLPACSLATQMSLFLGGFELQAKLVAIKTDTDPPPAGLVPGDPGKLELGVLPLTKDRSWQDVYTNSLYSTRLTADRRGRIEQEYPGSNIRQLSNERIAVLAETNVHVEILSLPFSRPKSRSPAAGRSALKKFSFRTEEPLPVEAVLSNLSQSFQLTIEWSAESTLSHRNRLVQLQAENVSQLELLQQVCSQADLRLEVRGDRIIVSPQ
jgi:hypothetical protein